MALALLEAKCKSVGAIYQVKAKPIRPLPGVASRSIRFAGSPNSEFSHIFEVTEATNRAFVMVFSSSLMFDENYEELARVVDAINRDSELGHWLYEEKPSIKQFCYLVTVDLGFSSSAQCKAEVLWQTILHTDQSYTSKAQLLSECQLVTKRVNLSESVDSFPSFFLNSLLPQLEAAYGKISYKTYKNCLDLQFMGSFSDEKLTEECRRFRGSLRMGEELYEVRVYFCDKGELAVFTQQHNVMELLHRINRFNVALGVGYFVFQSKPGCVCFEYKSYRQDFSLAQLPSHFRSLLSTLTTKLPVYFQWLQKYYLAPPYPSHHSDYQVIEKAYNQTDFLHEIEEITRFEQSKAGKYLLKSSYSLQSPSIQLKLPLFLPPLSHLWSKDLLPSQFHLQKLLHLLEKLKKSGLFYSNLQEIVYFTNEELMQFGVVVVPEDLYKNKTDFNGFNAFCGKICGKLQEIERNFMRNLTVKMDFSRICGEIIDFLSIKTRNSSEFNLGNTPVSLILVSQPSFLYLEMHNLLYQLRLFRKKSLDFLLLGLTITENGVYLVLESDSEWMSLATWRSSSERREADIERVVGSLVKEVKRLHGEGVFQLFLSPESVKVKGEVVRVVGIPGLTEGNVETVVRFTAPEVREASRRREDWEELNWQAADAYSLLCLCHYLHQPFPLPSSPPPSADLPAIRHSPRCRPLLTPTSLPEATLETQQDWSLLSRHPELAEFLTLRTK